MSKPAFLFGNLYVSPELISAGADVMAGAMTVIEICLDRDRTQDQLMLQWMEGEKLCLAVVHRESDGAALYEMVVDEGASTVRVLGQQHDIEFDGIAGRFINACFDKSHAVYCRTVVPLDAFSTSKVLQ